MIGQIFILFAVFFLMGAKNGFFYYRQLSLNFLMIITLLVVMCLYTIAFNVAWTFLPIALVLIWQVIIFQTGDSKQIHLSEYFVGFFVRLPFFFVTDIFMVMASVLLCDTLFKIPINISVGRNLIERVDGTDDNSGKSVGTYFLGKFYKVPRLFSNGYTKLYVGAAVFNAWVIAYYYGLRFNINHIYNYLGILYN